MSATSSLDLSRTMDVLNAAQLALSDLLAMTDPGSVEIADIVEATERIREAGGTFEYLHGVRMAILEEKGRLQEAFLPAPPPPPPPPCFVGRNVK